MSTTIADYDLSRHQVVQASAGTGKTHTIEQLVLRIIVDELATIDQILVVTFTEKATGELKSRLRDMLERALQAHPDHAALLRRSLDQFDAAPIFTIHGFCQGLLQEFAFEQQHDFQPLLTDDGELLRTLLGTIQRKTWRRQFGEQLREVLETAGYGRGEMDAWQRRVLKIASDFKPQCGHELRPALVPDWWRRLREPDANWAGQLEVFTILALREQLREHKVQRGLQSFDDMIAVVEQSLDADRNAGAASLLARLRQRYRFGIVDEFQDTDPLQWRIFRRIFLDGGDSRLLIVGDPKQAIYRFRGSDLPTYLHAVKEMEHAFDAETQTLEENWRSDPNLLEALNALFGDGDWFPREEGIGYVYVHAPDADCRTSVIEKDHTERSPLTIVDVTPIEKQSVARKHYYRFLVHEIQRLLGGPAPLLEFSLKKQPARTLTAGDICILIAKRPEAAPLITMLEHAGIPYNFYKRTGLWKCEEAIHLQILLETLAKPDDRSAFRKALLTCFFRVPAQELALAPDLPTQHLARQLFERWLEWSESRQWSALCRSLLEDTGLLFNDLSDVEADRRAGNLRLLLGELEQAALDGNLDLLGLVDWVKQQRESADGKQTAMTPDGAGRDRVKIMTIHASKGLEFPIVFLAGGFTKKSGDSSGYSAYHEDHHLIFDLRSAGEGKVRANQELLSEQRRLYYVALTRAIFKLYVPQVRVTERMAQYAGPIGEILAPALERGCPDKLGDTVARVVAPPLAAHVVKPAAPIAAREAEAPESPWHIEGPLFPAIDGSLRVRRIAVRSFSSMARHHLAQLGDAPTFGELPAVIADESAPQPGDDPLRGPVFGDMVHNVLEKIDFAEVGGAQSPAALLEPGAHALKLINAQVRQHVAQLHSRTPREQLADSARQQIAELVWRALHTPLTRIGGPLHRIAPHNRLAEIEFIYPEHPGDGPAPNARREDGFITGFIDLLFRHDGKYYLLDWKTNLLPAYDPEQIRRSMADADYPRQFGLYLQAIKRWLDRRLGPRDAFLDRFGGVYYLYLRGLNGRDDTAGVFFHRPAPADLDLAKLLT